MEKTYFSEQILDYSTLDPSFTFKTMAVYLKEMILRMESDLQLDDESQVFHAKIVFKERMVMYLL